MNHIYKLVWCASSGCVIAVSELASGSKKKVSSTGRKSLTTIALLSFSLSATAAPDTDIIFENAELSENNITEPILKNANIANVNTNNLNILNDNNIIKNGNLNHAIRGDLGAGTTGNKINITNSGNLTVSGDKATGIFSENRDTGDTVVSHTGKIITEGLAGHGIYTKVESEGAGQNITINVKNAEISTNDRAATNKNDIAYNIYAEQSNKNAGDVNIHVEDSQLLSKSSDYGSSSVYVKSDAKTGNLTAKLKNSDLQLDGSSADAINLVNYADDSKGNVTIETNSGSIHTHNSDKGVAYNYGIIGHLKGARAAGNVLITNNNTNIVTGIEGAEGHDGIGIYGVIDGGDSAGSVFIDNNGTIKTNEKGDMNIGIYAKNTGKGDIHINNTAGISTEGNASSTIHVEQAASASGKKRISNIVNTGNLVTKGNYSNGITLIEKNAENININNKGNAEIKGNYSHGIYLNTQGGNVSVSSSEGLLSTSGNTSHGIYINNEKSSKNDKVIIANKSDIITNGSKTGTDSSSSAIRVAQRGDGEIVIENNGNVLTKGIDAKNITVNAVDNAKVTVHNSGKLTTNNSTAAAIYSKGDISFTNNNDIVTANIAGKTNKEEVSAHGIEAVSGDGNVNVSHQNGNIIVENNTNSRVTDGITATAAKNATVSIGETAVVDAAKGDSGISLNTSQNGAVNIGRDAAVQGGRNSGVHFGISNGATGIYSINNAGLIGSENDHATNVSGSSENSIVNLNNSGVIRGYVSSDNKTALNMENSGEFLVRNQSDDTKKISVSSFNNGIVNNTGVVKLSDVKKDNIDTTGEYIPVSALSTSGNHIVQGQFLGVKEFSHSGVLDLTGAGLSGNSFIISGGQVAGENGNGTFITNGGTLKIATTLNEGSEKSRSDILVVDNLKKGSASTKLDIVIAEGSQDVATKNEGIQVVKTLGEQDAGAFELDSPVTYGRYEYLLYGDNATGTEDGYYLRNRLKKKEIIPNPNVGAYLGNQYAAMMFNQNILDRRDNVQSPDQTVWARFNYNRMKTDQISNTQELKINTALLQIGADFYRNEEKGQVAGAFIGYGDSDIKNRSYISGTKAEGNVRGVQLGGYYSWMPEKDNGPYTDVWGHIAHYNNKLKGEAQKNRDKKYDSFGFAISAEGGYSFIVSENDTNKWIVKPHAQVTYNYIDADDFTDHNNTRFSDNRSSGFETRLGARFYGNKKQTTGVLPFAEANWLYNGVSNRVDVNKSQVSSRIGQNVAELKLGLQGDITESSSVFIHIGGQKGNHDYQNISGQIGYNYNW